MSYGKLIGLGGGGTANATVPSVPYLSAVNTFSDSPLFVKDANTVEQRNGTTAQTAIVYFSYTSNGKNNGLQIGGSSIQTFKTGSDTANALTLNGGSGVVSLQGAGVQYMSVSSAALQASNAAIFTSAQGGKMTPQETTFALVNITAASRTDTLMSVGSGTGEAKGGTYRFSVCYVCKTAQGGATLAATISWNDKNSVAHTRVINLDLSSTSNYASDVVIMPCAPSQSIQVTQVITGGGTAAYDANGTTEFIY